MFCPSGLCLEGAYVLMELCMEGVLSKGVCPRGFCPEGVLSQIPHTYTRMHARTHARTHTGIVSI